eukprot:m.85500 g.85500  ORF g.85500 m.85500 type:complete len:533 (-) comp8389_c0_seq3:128-1726(-)
MAPRTPILQPSSGTPLACQVTWESANDQQLSCTRDEIVTFLSYWENGNYWMRCRNAQGKEGILRTEFLMPQLSESECAKVVSAARQELNKVLDEVRAAPLSDADVADPLVEVPWLPELAVEMFNAGTLNVLCDRIGGDRRSLKELKWCLGAETGCLAYICEFVPAACHEVIKRGLVPLLTERAKGLIDNKGGEIGVNSCAGQSVHVLAKLARCQETHKSMCESSIVKTVLEIFSNKKNAQHRWRERSHESNWSANTTFAWAAEFVSGLALHDAGRRALRSNKALAVCKSVEAEVEGATAVDHMAGTIALLSVRERAGTIRKGLFRRSSKSSAQTEGSDGYIMISYSWATQKLALTIKSFLESKGYSVWIDVEKIVGNIMNRMAEAVEGASMVLMLYSQPYADSRNCNIEAQYVQQLGKPYTVLLCEPGAEQLKGDGGRMLNIMRGTLLYIDIREESRHTKALDELERTLGSTGKGGGPVQLTSSASKSTAPTVLSRLEAVEQKLEQAMAKIATLESSMVALREENAALRSRI